MLQIPDPQRNELELTLQRIVDGATPSDLESETLDFKEESGSRDGNGERQEVEAQNEVAAKDLAIAASCFANSRGGVIVVGVSDTSSGADAIVGTAIDLTYLRQRIWELAEPNLTVTVEEREFLGHRLVIIYVPEGFELHKVRRNYSHRVGTTCQPMSHDDQRRILEVRRGYDWSSEATTIGIDRASAAAIDAVRKILLDTGEASREELASQSDIELIRRLGLSSNDCLNRAGVLLLIGPEEPCINFVKRDAPGADSRVREEYAGPLILGYLNLTRTISALNPTEHVQATAGVTRQMQRLPERAVRETIVNALIHRDWRLPDPVDVEFVGDQLAVNSPGGFMPGVDPTNVLSHPSKPRNRTLTSAMRSLRLAEREGVGVDRMYREMIRAGHAPPDIRDAGGRVRCVLLGGKPDAAVLSVTTSLDAAVRDDVDVNLAIHVLLSQPTVTPGELAPIIQKTVGEASAALSRAVETGVLLATKRMSDGHREYRLSDSVRKKLRPRLSYLSTSAAEAEAMIIQFIKDNGEIRNQDVTHLLGVKTVQASRILGKLRDNNVIISGSEHQAGPGVFYVLTDDTGEGDQPDESTSGSGSDPSTEFEPPSPETNTIF